LHKGDAFFGHHPEKGLKLGVSGFKALFIFVADLQYVAVFRGNDEHAGELLEKITVIIRDPPLIDGQLHGMFFATLINHVGTDRAFNHEIFVPVNEIGLDDELSLFEPLIVESSLEYVGLFAGELNKID
jgi:hypothetical protein